MVEIVPDIQVNGVSLSGEQVQWLENEYGIEENWRPIEGHDLGDEILSAVHCALPLTAEVTS